MDVRRIVFWVLALGLLAWVVHDPTGAGHTASHLVNTAIGWGQSAVTAVAAFVTSVA